ncbi:MAG TPA: aldolase/citrate lyase family protein [bacterium]|nr:aldolase/citrate lyase family protein [bacterium]
MTANSFRQRVHGGETVLGTILPLPSPEVAEITGLAGYDFLLLDMEHGPVTVDVLGGLVRACRAVNVAPLARVPEDHPKTILRALDVGCVGVMIPQVDTPQQAAAAVAATKYAPAGTRSLAGATAAAAWGKVSMSDHVASSNATTMSVLQIETRRGFEAVEAIARVPGVDVLFIGPSDLSQSLGHPGDPAHPDIQAAIRRIIGVGRAAGVPVGILALTPDDVRAYGALGATVFVDSLPRVLLRACQGQVRSMREAASGAAPPAPAHPR